MKRLLSLILLAMLVLPVTGSSVRAQWGPTGPMGHPLPQSVAGLKLDSPRSVVGVSREDIGGVAASRKGPQLVVVRLKTPAAATLAGHPRSVLRARLAEIRSEQQGFLDRWRPTSPETRVLGRLRLSLNAVLAEVETSEVPRLVRDPAVRSVRPVIDYPLALDETVPYVGAPRLHDLGVDGTGVRVAVVDTGIDYTHANLGGPGNGKSYRLAYGLDPSDSRNTTTDGLFPTAKVVGGFDFIGEEWPLGPLAPDPDPIDFNGHGTHVADIIGGRKGVAPGVDLYALKVCSALGGGCSGLALLQAMEFALDPNGDGDPSDRVDLVNMSLGAGYGQAFDDNLSAAVDNATRLGVLTVAAAGNGGNRPFITSTPGAAATAISVAQTQVPSSFLPTFTLVAPESRAGDYPAVFQPWSAPLTEPIQGPVQYADGAGGNRNGCAPFPPDSLEGKIVVVDRGTCFFSDKIRHIQEAGGVLGFIALVSGGQPFPGGFGGGSPITIPAYMVSQVDGNLLRGGEATIRLEPGQGHSLAGRIVDTSSRGPEYQDHRIKPEIGAPGASVSAEPGTGTGERPFGGTSGATPMVTGAAALLLQGNTPATSGSPDLAGLSRPGALTPLEVKALLMNTAASEVRNIADDALAPVTRIGAGELRVDRAFASPVAAWDEDHPTAALSFGFVEVADPEVTLARRVRVRNYSPQRLDFRVSASFRYADDAATGAVGFDLPDSVSVGAGEDAVFLFQLRIEGGRLRENLMDSGPMGNDPRALTVNEYDGYLTLDSDQQRIQLPWQVLPRKAARVNVSGALAGAGASVETRQSVPLPNLIELSNTGVGAAQNQAYSLLAVSPPLARGERGEQSPTPDLRSVGVQTFEVPGGFCSDRPSYVLAFAVNTWERQTHANWPGVYLIELDVDRDGTADYGVFNSDAGLLQGTTVGMSLSWAMDLRTGAAAAWFFTEHATNTANMVLHVCAEQIGRPPRHRRIDVAVTALDAYFGGPGDMVAGISFAPGEQWSLPAPLPDVPEGEEDFVTVAGPDTLANRGDGLGLLVFTNSDRGAAQRGGATQDTEALVLLRPEVRDAAPTGDPEVARPRPGTASPRYFIPD